jgi:hypothetical protein
MQEQNNKRAPTRSCVRTDPVRMINLCKAASSSDVPVPCRCPELVAIFSRRIFSRTSDCYHCRLSQPDKFTWGMLTGDYDLWLWKCEVTGRPDRPPVRFSRPRWLFDKTLYVQLTRLDFKNTISRSRENIFKKKVAQKMYLRWKAQILNNIANGPRSSEISNSEVATSIRYRE